MSGRIAPGEPVAADATGWGLEGSHELRQWCWRHRHEPAVGPIQHDVVGLAALKELDRCCDQFPDAEGGEVKVEIHRCPCGVLRITLLNVVPIRDPPALGIRGGRRAK